MNVSSAHNPSCSHSAHTSNGTPSQSLYVSQTGYQTQQTSISMKTAEGDVVTISGFAAAGSQVEQSAWRKAMETGYSFTEAAMQSTSLQMTVQGDLNAEELQDINNLLGDLQQISSTFFAGDSAQAMQDALAIGDMGSIQELQASFEYTAFASSQYAYQHPLPAKFDDQFQKMQEELASQSTSLETPLDQMLQAQWAQIEDFLNQQDEENQPQPAPPNAQTAQTTQAAPSADSSLETFMAAMKDRIDATIAKHPRLSPFALPVARKALHARHGAKPSEHSGHDKHGAGLLHRSILNGLKSWQLSA